MSDFPGLPEDLFRFLADLAAHNERTWFESHKDRYLSSVKDPMMSFIAAVGERLPAISPHVRADMRSNGGSLFRIYRDVRFSKDKKPYKENAGCQFRHEAGKGAHAPGFYVHLEPGRVFLGGGIWMPPADALRDIRTRIAEKPEEWAAVRTSPGVVEGRLTLEGEALKRPPRGFDADTPHMEDIRRKSFFLMASSDPGRAASPAFLDDVMAVFAETAPLMRFLCAARGLPF